MKLNKRQTRQLAFHIGTFLTTLGGMGILVGVFYDTSIMYGLIILLVGVASIVLPLIYILITPMDVLKKERERDGNLFD